MDVKNVKSSETTKFPGGAQRVEVPEAVEMICPTAVLELSSIYAEGASSYGAYNWAKNLPNDNTFRHLLRHLLLWRKGDRAEPHLAKVMWGAATLIHYEENCHCERTFDRKGDESDSGGVGDRSER